MERNLVCSTRECLTLLPTQFRRRLAAGVCAADSKKILSSQHEELGQNLTPGMTSKAFVRTILLQQFLCPSPKTKYTRVKYMTETDSSSLT